ncbi:MAG: c-type cytochrome [Rhodobacteraceae bacterium]|nr:c-type cytochrome [Paracoccaceae bacterium]
MKHCALVLFLLPTSVSAQQSALEDVHLSYSVRAPAEASEVKAQTTPVREFEAAEPGEGKPAGQATTPRSGDAQAFSTPSANLSPERIIDFKLGSALFHRVWHPAPATGQSSDGLGPLFNARSCEACHIRDGRGHAPTADDTTSFLLKLAVTSPEAGPDPVYGRQLQDIAIAGLAPEFRLRVTYETVPVKLSDGQTVMLRRPTYHTDALAYGPRHAGSRFSPRVAPQMIGLGLLEAIPVQDILANTDPLDADQDGISGRANIVFSQQFNSRMLGRFGHKATAATIRAQSAAAFANDIGISSPLHPDGWGDCTPIQARCRSAPDGGSSVDDETEISDDGLDFITHYSRNLGVPGRPDAGDAEVLQGKQLFYNAGCASCHQPKFVTHTLPDQPELSGQLIWPYSDMLLHDMGEGLADDFPDGDATGREWRTAPLWGIGLTGQVSGHTSYLHDGRARSLMEAILWHGGEADAAKHSVTLMSQSDRNSLLVFLNSL